ncbi:MAG: DUF4959 domain-containing protein [Mangrovibacterium sp.]
MKRYIYLLMLATLAACNSNDDDNFDVSFDELQVSFEAYPGGAFMNYSLPNDPDIYAIEARYKDFKGAEIVVKGTYTSSQIQLFGFNEAQSNVPVEIRLINHGSQSSDKIEKTFSTLESAPIEVFQYLEVKENWNGFKVEYRGLEDYTDGLMNIFYVGISPTTNQRDTLLVGTYPLQTGKFTFDYTDVPEGEENSTVVVKTEDFRGNVVKSQVFKEISIAQAEKFDCKNAELVGGKWLNDDSKKIHWKYLFDGDTKGRQALMSGSQYKYFSFKSEDGCVYSQTEGDNVWTIDLKEANVLAWVRIYSHIGAQVPLGVGSKLMPMKMDDEYYYPNSLVIYGTNDPNAASTAWVQLGSYSESQSLSAASKWIYPSLDRTNDYTAAQVSAFDDADPNYLQVNFDASLQQEFRYIKIKVLETFNFYLSNGTLGSSTGKVVMEELEVYKKKAE